MPRPNKPLNDMTPDEIAALSPEGFKELAGDHNDQVELRENARNRELEAKAEAMAKLTDRHIENELHDLGMKEADQGALDIGDCIRAGDLEAEQKRRALDGPDNPLNYDDFRQAVSTDERLTPEQRERVKTAANEPLSHGEQTAILNALEKPSGGYGDGRSVPDLTNPDKEVDEILANLVEEPFRGYGYGQDHSNLPPEQEPFGKSLIPAVIEAVKELPETVRTKMNPFRPMLKWDHEDDQERENTLRNGRW